MTSLTGHSLGPTLPTDFAVGENNFPYRSCRCEWGFLEPGRAGELTRYLGPELSLGPDLESQGWEMLLGSCAFPELHTSRVWPRLLSKA